MELGSEISPRKLKYSIHSCSSVSQSFHPDNILEDKPFDQASRYIFQSVEVRHDLLSRWSSDTNKPPQFLSLRLERPSLVTSITFGKYEKAHVCNLKHFKVLGGPDEDNMIELLDAGLKNDTVSEHFSLRHKLHGHLYPVSLIKILPLRSGCNMLSKN